MLDLFLWILGVLLIVREDWSFYVDLVGLVFGVFKSVDKFLGNVDPCDSEEVPVLLFGTSFVHFKSFRFVGRLSNHA